MPNSKNSGNLGKSYVHVHIKNDQHIMSINFFRSNFKIKFFVANFVPELIFLRTTSKLNFCGQLLYFNTTNVKNMQYVAAELYNLSTKIIQCHFRDKITQM